MEFNDFKIEREEDLLRLIASLDITKTLYDNAVDKYTALAAYLNSQDGISADIYPQGSFALRTVVKSIFKNKNADYDLDFVCQVSATRNDIGPMELRKRIIKALEDNKVYKDRLKPDETCLTIDYADVGDSGFSIDIVPAAEESEERKAKLKIAAERPDLVDSSIVIPKKDDKTAQLLWITSNPKGYVEWFNDINGRFSEFSSSFYHGLLEKRVFEQKAEVEDVPELTGRTSLQVVIQILKFHRDVYFTNLNKQFEAEKYPKPISAIINTLVAKIAIGVNPKSDIFTLLEYVLNELAIYSVQQTQFYEDFIKNNSGKDLIEHTSTRWIIKNPSNPEDNLADTWTNDTAKMFFKWTIIAKRDLIDSLSEKNDGTFRAIAENAFTSDLVKSVWGEKYIPQQMKKPTIIQPTKPWLR